MMLDTKNFILRTGVRTFEAAAYLRRMGADTVEVKRLFASTMQAYQERCKSGFFGEDLSSMCDLFGIAED